MTRAVALFLAMLMIAVPLAGCTGDDVTDDDDTVGDDTELNAANERIAELEAQAEIDQARIVELEEMCCTLEEMAVQYQFGYDEGYEAGLLDAERPR